MRLTNFFQICFYISLSLIVFTLAVNFVNGLELFYTVDTGYTPSEMKAESIFGNITGLSGGMEYIWMALLSVTGIAAFIIARLMNSITIVGIWLFSSVFWTSYTRFVTTVNINSWIPMDFMIIFTVGILFLWVGALISMLSGV